MPPRSQKNRPSRIADTRYISRGRCWVIFALFFSPAWWYVSSIRLTQPPSDWAGCWVPREKTYHLTLGRSRTKWFLRSIAAVDAHRRLAFTPWIALINPVNSIFIIELDITCNLLLQKPLYWPQYLPAALKTDFRSPMRDLPHKTTSGWRK